MQIKHSENQRKNVKLTNLKNLLDNVTKTQAHTKKFTVDLLYDKIRFGNDIFRLD